MECYNLSENDRDRCFLRIPPSYYHLEVCHGFKIEQEPVFSHKPRVLIDDPKSGMWVVRFTKRVIHVCASLLIAAYEEYRLWYVPTDIISFARGLSMAMEVVLGSHSNVRKLLEILEVIESTRFDTIPNAWNCRTSRACDYHSGRYAQGGDFVYYAPLSRRKIDQQTAWSRVAATRVTPDYVPTG